MTTQNYTDYYSVTKILENRAIGDYNHYIRYDIGRNVTDKRNTSLRPYQSFHAPVAGVAAQPTNGNPANDNLFSTPLILN